MEQALPIADVYYDESVDESGDISMLTAEQYMSFVRKQATRIPAVVRAANIDTSVFRSNQTKYIPIVKERFDCPTELLPDAQWENEQLFAFSEQRSKISRLADDPTNRVRKVNVPKLKEEDSWHEFCFRSELPPNFRDISTSSPGFECSEQLLDGGSDEDPEESIDDSLDEAQATAAGGGAAHGDEIAESMWAGPFDVAPSVSLLLQFDQVMCQRLLNYHIMWLNHYSITQARAQWLFHLLLYISKPLHRDLESDIRHLHRVSSKQRSSLINRRRYFNDDLSFHDAIRTELSILNLLILISGSYFGQSENGRAFDYNKSIAGNSIEEDEVEEGEVDDDYNDYDNNEEDYDNYDNDDDIDEDFEFDSGMNLETTRTKRAIDSDLTSMKKSAS